MPATDTLPHSSGGMSSPARGAFAITPHNTNELTHVTRGLYVGGAGNAAVTMAGGEEVTFTGLLAGVVYPLRVKIVKSTGTTATALVGLY